MGQRPSTHNYPSIIPDPDQTKMLYNSAPIAYKTNTSSIEEHTAPELDSLDSQLNTDSNSTLRPQLRPATTSVFNSPTLTYAGTFPANSRRFREQATISGQQQCPENDVESSTEENNNAASFLTKESSDAQPKPQEITDAKPSLKLTPAPAPTVAFTTSSAGQNDLTPRKSEGCVTIAPKTQ